VCLHLDFYITSITTAHAKLTTRMAETSPPSESSWATLIGIVICLSGNVIISFALNIQRLAHERIQRYRHTPLHRTATDISSTTYGAPHPKDDDENEEPNEGLYLKSKLWWTGLVLMAIGETGNFVACISPMPPPSSIGGPLPLTRCFIACIYMRRGIC
jgi:magnesium transporter